MGQKAEGHRDEQAISASGCWGPDPGPLEEQQAFSTPEPLSSPRVTCLSIYGKILLKNHGHVQK